MLRWSIVFLLIATLVACPFRCGGAFGDTCAHESTGNATATTCGCDCCRSDATTEPGRDQRSDPVPGPCDCGGCVCEGAVLPEKVEFVALDPVAMPFEAMVPGTLTPESRRFSVNRVPIAVSEPMSGRAVRVLHRSLLL